MYNGQGLQKTWRSEDPEAISKYSLYQLDIFCYDFWRRQATLFSAEANQVKLVNQYLLIMFFITQRVLPTAYHKEV